MGSGRSSRRNGSSARPSASSCEGAQQDAVAFLAENDVRAADALAILEERDTFLAGDLRPIGETKFLLGKLTCRTGRQKAQRLEARHE